MVNMHEYQLKQKDDEFSLKILKEGKGITSYQVNKMINEFFENKVPGLPYYKPIQLKNYTRSDKADYNKMFSNIEQDLKNAFEVYNSQTDYQILLDGDYDMKMQSTNKELDALVLQAELLEKYTETKTAYEPHILKFNDLSNVNTVNLITNNVPETTSEIDYDKSTLRNELLSSPGDKFDLENNSEITFESDNSKVSVDSDVSLITNELKNSIVTVTTKTISNTPASLTINIKLNRPYEASRITLDGYSLYNTHIRLFLSEDGTNFYEKSNIEGDLSLVWRFNSMKIKAIKIIINKTSFDYISDKGEGFCYYMFSNISVYYDIYKRTSVFASKTIEFEQPISDITLDAVHELPPHTEIAYYVGFENGLNNVEWKSIEPEKTIDLGLLKKEEKILFNSGMSNIYGIFGKCPYDKLFKTHFFEVESLPDNTNVNSVDVRAGHSQWLIERLDVTDKYSGELPTDNKCHTNDYSKRRITAIAPLDAEIMEIRCEKENNYFVMSQYVICEEDTIIENRYINFDVENEIFDKMVLVNGRQIFTDSNNKYSFKLRKGENIIQLMFLLGKLDITGLDNEEVKIKTIKHNFNLLANCKAIFAGPQMQRINYNSLLKNTTDKSLKYYAIKSLNVNPYFEDDLYKDVIVVKFPVNAGALKTQDPQMYDVENTEVNINNLAMANLNYNTDIKDMTDITYQPNYDENNNVIKPSPDYEYPEYEYTDVFMNNSKEFRMYVKYKYMLNSTKSYITNNKNNSNVRLRVMARLVTSDKTVTPAINSIKIVGE